MSWPERPPRAAVYPLLTSVHVATVVALAIDLSTVHVLDVMHLRNSVDITLRATHMLALALTKAGWVAPAQIIRVDQHKRRRLTRRRRHQRQSLSSWHRQRCRPGSGGASGGAAQQRDRSHRSNADRPNAAATHTKLVQQHHAACVRACAT